MKLPDSIEMLTEERKGDSFFLKPEEAIMDTDSIVYFIKQKVMPEYAKSLDEGLVCIKQVHNDSAMIKCLLNIYRDTLIRGIKKTTLEDGIKDTAITSYTNLFSSINVLLDTQAEMLSVLNKQKKVIDINEISYIILGYAIDTIKKINSRK